MGVGEWRTAVGRFGGFFVGLGGSVGEGEMTAVGLVDILIGVWEIAGFINPAVVAAGYSFTSQAIIPDTRSSPRSTKIQCFNLLRPLLPQSAYPLEKVWLSLCLLPL